MPHVCYGRYKDVGWKCHQESCVVGEVLVVARNLANPRFLMMRAKLEQLTSQQNPAQLVAGIAWRHSCMAVVNNVLLELLQHLRRVQVVCKLIQSAANCRCHTVCDHSRALNDVQP